MFDDLRPQGRPCILWQHWLTALLFLFKSTDLHRAMLSALVGHKPDFVKLFLANNVSLREFLHEDTLCELYAHLEPGCLFLQRLRRRMKAEKANRNQLERLARSQVSLRHVSEEVHHFLGSFTQPLYSLKNPCAETPEEDVCVTVRSHGALRCNSIACLE